VGQRRAVRLLGGRRLILTLAGAAIIGAAVFTFYLILIRPAQRAAHDSLQGQLDARRAQLEEYALRVETRMELELLLASLDGGRRSEGLRRTYSRVEDKLEEVALATSAGLQDEINGGIEVLSLDLSRDRPAARREIVALRDALLGPAGPGRQGPGARQ